MKKIILFFVFAALLSSCHKSKSDIVEDYVNAKNSYVSGRISNFLTEDFEYYDGTDTLNKSDYLKK